MRKVTGAALVRQTETLGNRYGSLVAKVYLGHDPNRHAIFSFCCDCGSEKQARLNDAKNGKVTSCGCESGKYSIKNKRLYHIWYMMIVRCTKPEAKDYKYYGARGIKVCHQWHDYEVWLYLINGGHRYSLN
jgi:hypothetical protein